MPNRRQFLTSASAVAALTYWPLRARADSPRKRIAFLGTEVRQHSHAQHFLDRLCMGYASGGKWRPPALEVAGVYIDQKPEGDLAPQRLKKYQLHEFPSVEEALTLGGDKLAVDGVVIIAEHGDFPVNEKGQRLYPRYEWFKKVVKVFEDSDRAVPVFNDKHLATQWNQCQEMCDDAKRLDFPFLAGSSLPVTWRLPGIDVPWGAKLTESVCVAYGGVDSYDFHALETAQCMSERRAGGEVGINSVLALRNQAVWEHLKSGDRNITKELVIAALNRSHNLPVETGYPTAPVTLEWARSALPNVVAYFIEHRDGFRTSVLMTDIRDFNYAGRLADSGETISCQMHLPMPTQSATTADFFNPLVGHIETLISTGKAPYPVARTLLTSGMVIGGVESLYRNQQLVETPEMAVNYQAPQESQYWRE